MSSKKLKRKPSSREIQLRGQVLANQVSIKDLIQTREVYPGDRVAGMIATRGGSKNSLYFVHRTGVKKKDGKMTSKILATIALRSGIKTATNEIQVMEERILSLYDIDDLKKIQKHLRKLRGGLAALPPQSKRVSKRSPANVKLNGAPKKRTVDLENILSHQVLRKVFQNQGDLVSSVFCEYLGFSSKKRPFFQFQIFGSGWEEIGKVILVDQEDPCWLSRGGEYRANGEGILAMKEQIKKAVETVFAVVEVPVSVMA